MTTLKREARRLLAELDFQLLSSNSSHRQANAHVLNTARSAEGRSAPLNNTDTRCLPAASKQGCDFNLNQIESSNHAFLVQNTLQRCCELMLWCIGSSDWLLKPQFVGNSCLKPTFRALNSPQKKLFKVHVIKVKKKKKKLCRWCLCNKVHAGCFGSSLGHCLWLALVSGSSHGCSLWPRYASNPSQQWLTGAEQASQVRLGPLLEYQRRRWEKDQQLVLKQKKKKKECKNAIYLYKLMVWKKEVGWGGVGG